MILGILVGVTNKPRTARNRELADAWDGAIWSLSGYPLPF